MEKFKKLIFTIIVLFTSCSEKEFRRTVLKKHINGIDGIEIVDINNDNLKDIIYTSPHSNEINCLININNFEFEERTICHEKLYVKDVISQDIDKDGDIDLICGTSKLGPIILEQKDNFEFKPHYIDSTIKMNTSLQVVDINNDGVLDIIASSNNGNELKWNENMGQFNFKSHLISGNISNIKSIKTGDLNDDGLKDIVCSSEKMKNVTAFINSSNQVFSQLTLCNQGQTDRIELEDINGDNIIDLICASKASKSIHIHCDTSEWTEFINIAEFVEAHVHSMIVADIDKNGQKDLIYQAHGKEEISALYQIDSSFLYKPFEGYTRNVFNINVDDIDQDGDMDLIHSSESLEEIILFRNLKNNTFSFQNLYIRFKKYDVPNRTILQVGIFILLLLFFILRKNIQFKDAISLQMEEIKQLQRLNETELTSSLNEKGVAQEKWDKFFKLNKEINPNFINHLQGEKLTIHEIRLCILIRSQLNNHEISDLLSINVKSVYMKRQRVSKKLNLESSKNLDEYLTLF
tara:strand:+ start:2094 stop:3653 length:1560 start_codon:yes stop_codon:yes gene_type:complete